MTSTASQLLWTEASNKDVKGALRNWTDELFLKGQASIDSILPARILALNAIIADQSDASPFHIKENHVPWSDIPLDSPTVEAETSTTAGRKKRKVTNGKEAVLPASIDQAQASPGLGGVKNPSHVSSSAEVNSQYIFMRHHWEELISITNDIKVYINLLVPKIEDGDTFGVQVQEECLAELGRAQDSGYNLLDAQFKHHLARAKLASKLIKYPNLEDYQLALKEHDRKSSYLCRQHLIDLRNIYTFLTDLLHKNIAKLIKPKGANSNGM
ncbi:hypothetical protein CROQUDRAFT_43162 [Cronartium quercuum f. sp. fusiforme G11]|uniref:Proteasome activator PA28 C-terminal domain-containing protein n=1 Tax=Cronartium quercuum f. sp. fusiforme G11 TaxID=708437 RepID=A0A9P6NHV0_9BASI|nr:hypothetical protein CROQUDRAFT_43162 [Cronartium quercuum f. sp. fusiforme G11]